MYRMLNEVHNILTCMLKQIAINLILTYMKCATTASETLFDIIEVKPCQNLECALIHGQIE
jgi:hypothetical protein